MKDETREELERIEKELLAQEPEAEEFPEEDLFKEALAEPAFEDMDEINEPEEPMVYCNFSNDYGRVPEEEEQKTTATGSLSKSDKVDIGLMIAASALGLGIIFVMIYWLVNFLK